MHCGLFLSLTLILKKAHFALQNGWRELSSDHKIVWHWSSRQSFRTVRAARLMPYSFILAQRSVEVNRRSARLPRTSRLSSFILVAFGRPLLSASLSMFVDDREDSLVLRMTCDGCGHREWWSADWQCSRLWSSGNVPVTSQIVCSTIDGAESHGLRQGILYQLIECAFSWEISMGGTNWLVASMADMIVTVVPRSPFVILPTCRMPLIAITFPGTCTLGILVSSMFPILDHIDPIWKFMRQFSSPPRIAWSMWHYMSILQCYLVVLFYLSTIN